MDNITIEKILGANSQTQKIFQGCFPCDLLPNPAVVQYPAAFIINNDVHTLKGSHWVGFYAKGIQEEAYFFDSLALPINEIIKTKFLNKFMKVVKNVNI